MKSLKYWICAIGGTLLFIFIIVSGIYKFLIASEGLSALRYLNLEIVAGLIMLNLFLNILWHIRQKNIYIEIHRIKSIIDTSRSLIFEYSVKKDEYVWYGDAEKLFMMKEKNRSLDSVIHPDDLPVIMQQVEDAKHNKVYAVDARLADVNNGYHVCLCRMVPSKEITGSVKKIFGEINMLKI